jgi:hypothetical protein
MESSCLLVTHVGVNVVMKTIVCLLTFLFFEANIVLGDVSLSVYEADGTTPFDGRNIIVGTELTIIISSDSGDYWSGGVFLAGDNRGLGVLSARGWDPNTLDWAGSRTEAAGAMATVWEYRDSWLWGCDLYTDSYGVEAGDWFILDYEATAVGDPNFGFYDYSQSWEEPISTVTLSQFPSPDFDDSGIVNLADFSHFSLYWLENDCEETSWCYGADLNTDTVIDMQDLWIFSVYWLWGATDPNSQQMMMSGGGSIEMSTQLEQSELEHSKPTDTPFTLEEWEEMLQGLEEAWYDESKGVQEFFTKEEWFELIENLRVYYKSLLEANANNIDERL